MAGRRLGVGQIVEAIPPFSLVCGSGMYSRAVVVSVDPLVCVSESGDMLWRATITDENIRPIGTAFPDVFATAWKRYATEIDPPNKQAQAENQ